MKEYQFRITSRCITKGYFDYSLEKTSFIESGNDVNEALLNLCETLNNDYRYTITKNALRKKEPIYRDAKDGSKQVGFLIKAHSEARNDTLNKWVKIVSDLCIEINEISSPFEAL